MTRYGYARVSTREQSTDHQVDALLAAGVAEQDLFVEKISGKLASRPKLDALLSKLQPKDQEVVTRLRRIGRSHQHLLDLVRGFGENDVDFVVLEQGIDTSTPGGRLIFHFLAALAEYDRELIVEGTLDGLAAAKARGRVGGRPRALNQIQLDQAQRMYDEDQLTVDQIADTPQSRPLHPLRMLDALRQRVRQADGRDAEPSAGIIDSQSVKGADTVGRDSLGHDAGKKVAGRKRFIVTDTLGLLITVTVCAASVQDRDGAKGALLGLYPG